MTHIADSDVSRRTGTQTGRRVEEVSSYTGCTDVEVGAFLTRRLTGITLTVDSVGEEVVGTRLLTTIVPEEEIGTQIRYA